MLQLLVAFIAQTDPASLPAELSAGDALTQALQVVGGLKGAGAVAIAMAVTQILMLVMRTKLAEFTGLWRWFVYSGVSLVSVVLSVKLSGSTWVGALLAGPTMTALGNWLHQVPVQVAKAKEEKSDG